MCVHNCVNKVSTWNIFMVVNQSCGQLLLLITSPAAHISCGGDLKHFICVCLQMKAMIFN